VELRSRAAQGSGFHHGQQRLPAIPIFHATLLLMLQKCSLIPASIR
jgi:hypothetical protein